MNRIATKAVSAVRSRAAATGSVVGLSLVSGAAFASDTGTSEAVAAIGELQTQATDMISAAWPFAVAIVGASVGMKLFKKFANRAS